MPAQSHLDERGDLRRQAEFLDRQEFGSLPRRVGRDHEEIFERRRLLARRLGMVALKILMMLSRPLLLWRRRLRKPRAPTAAVAPAET